MESGKKEETNKSTVIRLKIESGATRGRPTRIFSAIRPVLECDPIRAKRVNFPIDESHRQIFHDTALDISQHAPSYSFVCCFVCLPVKSRAGDLGPNTHPELVRRLSLCYLDHELKKEKRTKLSLPPRNRLSSARVGRFDD